LRISGLVLALSAALSFFPVSLEGADANGDTRTISIFNVHTNESGTVTFKRNGVYDAEGLKQLSWLLRDWRRDEPIAMSPHLFDILWEVHQESGSQEAFGEALTWSRSTASIRSARPWIPSCPMCRSSGCARLRCICSKVA
jgi:uncharacterized protein YcbK (DUF882 family)